MGLSKCARCKKLFSKIQSPVCPRCQPDEDADFAKIHHVIGKHAGLKAEEIAAQAEVDLGCVMRMLNEGRLGFEVLTEKPVCGRCGAPAISMAKRLCESCLAELDRECASAIRDIQKELPRGVKARGGAASALGEKRAEAEAKRTSEAIKRTNELHERVHPSQAGSTVAREARERKGR